MNAIPPAGAHGGDGPAIARALGRDVLDLSQTMNPFAPDIAPIVARHASAARAYPDTDAATEALADVLGVAPSRLLITNGGSEAIALVAAEVGGGVVAEPEFSLHPRGDGPRWRSDPHNPSGRLADDGDDVDVWDEAFYPLATGRWTAGRPGITVGSLTKVFACPGLRLGYLVADDVDRFARHRPMWSVGSVALAALPDLLAAADLPPWSAQIAEARNSLVAVLERHELSVCAADAPWVLVDSPGLRERLAPEGIVVRDCGSFGMPGWHRLAVSDRHGLDWLDAALAATT